MEHSGTCILVPWEFRKNFFWEYFESQWRVLPTTDSVVTSCCKGGIDKLS